MDMLSEIMAKDNEIGILKNRVFAQEKIIRDLQVRLDKYTAQYGLIPKLLPAIVTGKPLPQQLPSVKTTAQVPEEFREFLHVMGANPACHKRRVIARDGFACCWCRKMTDPRLSPNAPMFPTLEHLTRRADGGTSGMSNLAIACRKCNGTRHDKFPDAKPVVRVPPEPVRPMSSGAIRTFQQWAQCNALDKNFH